MTDLPKFELMGLLGVREHGNAYLARSASGKTVVLRLLKEPTPNTLSIYSDMAKKHQLLNANYLISLSAPVQIADGHAVVWPLVKGSSARVHLNKRSCPNSVALTIASDIANGLQHAWNKTGPDGNPLNICHGNLDPSKIIITTAGVVRLLDFGSSPADLNSLDRDTPMGNGVYIAPEAWAGEVSPASDIYALGIILRELITGKRPISAVVTEQGGFYDEEEEDIATDVVDQIALNIMVLAARMCDHNPAGRPTLDQVAASLTTLKVDCTNGPTLSSWATMMPSEPEANPLENTKPFAIPTPRRKSQSSRSAVPGMFLGGAIAAIVMGTLTFGGIKFLVNERRGQEVLDPVTVTEPTNLISTPDVPEEEAVQVADEVPTEEITPPSETASPIDTAIPIETTPDSLPIDKGKTPQDASQQQPTSAVTAPKPTQPAKAAPKPEPIPVAKPVPEPVPMPVPEPVPMPVPEPVPTTVPVPVPKPDSLPANSATIALSGDGVITLKDASSATVSTRAGIKPGTYTVWVSFDGAPAFQAKTFTAKAGATHSIKCMARMGSCFVK